MKRMLLLLGAFISFALAQYLDPYLDFQQKTTLAKAPQQTLSVLVSGQEGLSERLLKAGFDVQSDLDNRATVRLPAHRLSDLLAVPGLQRVTYKPKAKLYNSKAVNYQQVSAAYAKGYTGSGVVVGIVDTGIDFYHPMFRKQDGTTRIIAIWDQTADGTAPKGYSYGTEYTEQQINQDLQSGTPHSIVHQRDTQGHGTHVAGSAAGYDYNIQPPDTLHGGAIDANLVIVKTTMQSSDIIDGIHYIFDKATELGKPCVVNISLGLQYGPHDGTDDDNQAMNDLSGPGRIIVHAAGNEGGDNIHYFKSNVVSSESITFGYTQYFNLWIEKGDQLNSASLTWNGGEILNVVPGSNKAKDNVYLYVESASAHANQQIACIVFIDDTSYSNTTFTLTLQGLSDANHNGTIKRHGWSDQAAVNDPYGAFSQGNSYGNFHYPYTLANDATAEEIITVGAFISRENWPANDGNTYHFVNAGKESGIAAFSGIGPTADGRNKPDIVAGGSIVLSARSKDVSYPYYYIPPSPYNSDYAYNQGTSMAAPVAAGAIALLLEKNPDWGPDEVKAYLFNNAQSTSINGQSSNDEVIVKETPNTWDRVFGYGAIDLTKAFNAQAIESENINVARGFQLYANYPNPFNPQTHIRYHLARAAQIRLTVYNARGQKIATLTEGKQNAGTHSVLFDGSSYASGIYFYVLNYRTATGDNGQLSAKMLLVK